MLKSMGYNPTKEEIQEMVDEVCHCGPSLMIFINCKTSSNSYQGTQGDTSSVSNLSNFLLNTYLTFLWYILNLYLTFQVLYFSGIFFFGDQKLQKFPSNLKNVCRLTRMEVAV